MSYSSTNYTDVLSHLLPLVKGVTDEVELNELHEATLALTKLNKIGEYYDHLELNTELSSIVSEVRSSSEADKEDQLLRDLHALISRLQSQVDYWRIVVPISNLTIRGVRRIQVGNVTFFTFTDRLKRKALSDTKTLLTCNVGNVSTSGLDKEPTTDEHMGDMVKAVEESLNHVLGKTCAETVVFGRRDNILDDALPKMEEALAALKLFRGIKAIPYERHFGIPGSIVPSTRMDMMQYSKGRKFASIGFYWVGALIDVDLDSPRVRYIFGRGLRELSAILAKDNRTELEEKIVTSILWFAKATDVALTSRMGMSPFDLAMVKRSSKLVQAKVMSSYDRLLRLMVSLETLLIFNENEPIASNLAERVAFMVAKKYGERKGIVSFVKHMYGYRSAIIHHGGKGIPEHDLNAMMYLAQRVIMQILTKRKRLKIDSVDSLQEWFIKEKLS